MPSPENPADPSSTNLKQLKSSMERVIATGKPDTTPILRYAIPVRDGEGSAFEDRYWNAVHTPVFGKDGNVALVVQNPIDVTGLYRFDCNSQSATARSSVAEDFNLDHFSRAQMHEAMMRVLKDERSHLRNLFNQSPGFVAVTMGLKYVFEMVNDAYYQLVGDRDLLGKPAFEALPELVEQGFKELLDGVYQTGKPWVGHGLKVQVQPEGSSPMVEHYIDVVYQPFHDADGKVIGIFAQGHDVTDSYIARAAERAIEARWELALEASGGGTWDWHLQTDKLDVSSAWKAIVGYAEDELDDSFENLAQQLIHPDDLPQVRADIEAHLMGRTKQLSSQHRLHHKNGS